MSQLCLSVFSYPWKRSCHSLCHLHGVLYMFFSFLFLNAAPVLSSWFRHLPNLLVFCLFACVLSSFIVMNSQGYCTIEPKRQVTAQSGTNRKVCARSNELLCASSSNEKGYTLGKTVGNTSDRTVYTKVRVYRHCVKTICFVETLLGGGLNKKTKQEQE